MHTIEEQERAAYVAGDTPLAGALAAQIDAEEALAGERLQMLFSGIGRGKAQSGSDFSPGGR